MNMIVRVPGPITIGKGVIRDRMLEKIACAIEQHGMKNLGGFDRIEDLTGKAVAELPIGEGTIFALIAGVLAEVAHIITDGTVGGVMEALGYERESDEAAAMAHEIGCRCHGLYISTMMAAARVRNLKGTI